MRLRKPAPEASPSNPPCPKCGRDTLVVLDLKATQSGFAAHLACSECRITTHAWRPANPRPGAR